MYELGRLVSAVSGALKLQPMLPEPLMEEVLVRRFRDEPAVTAVIDSTRAGISSVGSPGGA